MWIKQWAGKLSAFAVGGLLIFLHNAMKNLMSADILFYQEGRRTSGLFEGMECLVLDVVFMDTVGRTALRRDILMDAHYSKTTVTEFIRCNPLIILQRIIISFD